MKDNEIFVLAGKQTASDQEAGRSSSQTLIYLALVACFLAVVISSVRFYNSRKSAQTDQANGKAVVVGKPISAAAAVKLVAAETILETIEGEKVVTGELASLKDEQVLAVINGQTISLVVPQDGLLAYSYDRENYVIDTKLVREDNLAGYQNQPTNLLIQQDGNLLVLVAVGDGAYLQYLQAKQGL